MYSQPFKVIITAIISLIVIIVANASSLRGEGQGEMGTRIVSNETPVSPMLAKNDGNSVSHPELVSGSQMMPGQEIPKQVRDDGKNDRDAVFSGGKKVDAKKGIVAFIELSSPVPTDVYLMYPTQYNKYKASGLLEGVIEFKEISWLFYPVPALLEDQTVYIVSKGNITFNITYENIQERLDRLFAGEEQLRAGTEMSINNGITVVRLTQLIPGLKVKLDLTENAQFVITRTIDLARYNKGLKGFDQIYKENALKGSNDHLDFITSDFEDLYLLVRTDNQIRLKYMIWATKESAESGC